MNAFVVGVLFVCAGIAVGNRELGEASICLQAALVVAVMRLRPSTFASWWRGALDDAEREKRSKIDLP